MHFTYLNEATARFPQETILEIRLESHGHSQEEGCYLN